MPKRGLRLVKKEDRSEASGVYFRPDQAVLEDGIYRAFHAGHRLSHEITLLAGSTFPRCANCGTAVHFELIRTAPALDPDFRIQLYTIPHPDDEEEEKTAAG